MQNRGSNGEGVAIAYGEFFEKLGRYNSILGHLRHNRCFLVKIRPKSEGAECTTAPRAQKVVGAGPPAPLSPAASD